MRRQAAPPGEINGQPGPPAEGKIIAECMPQHRPQEWIRFLKRIDKDTPPNLDLHLIVDNYATHKHPKVLAWLKKHPRFHMHFTPTSASWLNVIERGWPRLTAGLPGPTQP
jgi:hypothetical protein